MAYFLKLLLTMKRLHLVFNVIKLTTTFEDLIFSRHLNPLSDPILIYKQEKWEVEMILDSY